MPTNSFNIDGLSAQEVAASQEQYGKNILVFKKENAFLKALKSIVEEPMVIILLLASAIYFISGKTGDGIFLACAVVFEAVISLYQVSKSRNAMAELKSYTKPLCKVVRAGEVTEIDSEELVMSDFMVVEEGGLIAADGTIVQSNDFTVNESILTGESMSVTKDQSFADNEVYKGTLVVSGLAVVQVTAIGNETRIGKIGKSIDDISEETTPLEKQINNFVKQMMVAGVVIFLLEWGINYVSSRDLPDSLLKALTLAMSVIPEEIPVALATFMALGAWRMLKMGIVVKQMKTVETLGSATVICADKTGTITRNEMELVKLYVAGSKTVTDPKGKLTESELALVNMAMWASEPVPFDPMEVELHDVYGAHVTKDDRPGYSLVHEYPLGGRPPMMTHVFCNNDGNKIIAAKGAPEAFLEIPGMTAEEQTEIKQIVEELAAKGYRLLGVGEGRLNGEQYPATQQEIKFDFLGMVAFYDPPKANISEVLGAFYKAGIQVKIITGDSAPTTEAIASQVGFRGISKSVTGTDIMAMDEAALQKCIKKVNLYTRMFPEAKLRVVNALKEAGEIVAMTGDGVNDGPALKAAHIGVAMGKNGSEIARQAASLVLLDDDLRVMVDAIAMGRRIYSNLKKAIRYIISIHIPIILTVFLPLVLGWVYPNIFSPVHVIFLELIMGPTCSIIFENEPIELFSMSEPPRSYTKTFFNWSELRTSIIQGLAITAGVLVMYQYAVSQGYSIELTRTMVFATLMTANILLTHVNRSFYYSIFTTLKYKNNLVPLITITSVCLTLLMLYLPPLSAFFGFKSPNGAQLGYVVLAGAASVLWYEIVKVVKRRRQAEK